MEIHIVKQELTVFELVSYMKQVLLYQEWLKQCEDIGRLNNNYDPIKIAEIVVLTVLGYSWVRELFKVMMMMMMSKMNS